VTPASVDDAAARSADKLIRREVGGRGRAPAPCLGRDRPGLSEGSRERVEARVELEPGQYLIVDVTDEDGDGLTDAQISAVGPDGRVRRPALDDEARS
jgi:hypothetical protein